MDAETGELHPELSDGQRMHELLIATGNLSGELMDVERDVGLPAGRLRVRVRATATGHHRRLVKRLVGLDVQENQARRLLNEVYRPTLDAVPSDERAKLDDAELFHQLLEHRWYMSEREGRAIPLATVLPSYLARIPEPMPGPAADSAAPEDIAD